MKSIRFNELILVRRFYPNRLKEYKLSHDDLVDNHCHDIIEELIIKIVYDTLNETYRIIFDYGIDIKKEYGYLYDIMDQYAINKIFDNIEEVQDCIDEIYNVFHNTNIKNAYNYDYIGYVPWNRIINTNIYMFQNLPVYNFLNLSEISKIIDLKHIPKNTYNDNTSIYDRQLFDCFENRKKINMNIK